MASRTAPAYNSIAYKANRPTYPRNLFEMVYKHHKSHAQHGWKRALDVGTGTGQTALELAKDFDSVLGLDPSKDMIKEARSAVAADQGHKLQFEVGDAEDLGVVPSESIDLVTASTAAHWFEMPAFYKEAHRVLVPSGTLAYWAYGHFYSPEFARLGPLIKHFSEVTMHPYWDNRRPRLDRMYSDPEFLTSPFASLKRRVFDDVSEPAILKMDWTLKNVQLFLETWSPYKTWLEKGSGPDPIQALMKTISDEMGAESLDHPLEVRFPIVLIVCKK
ncbi:hypothetical protein HDV03_004698 [Kappamyces sp. JEL0829]|nr:hypothetical protein HDV03_004698 [Kappamyces sp. JEL0829]